jgi:hypothetical protein
MLSLLSCQTLSSVLMSLLVGLVGSLILILFIFRHRLCLPPIWWAALPPDPLLYPDISAGGPGGVLDSHIIYIQVSAVFATYMPGLLSRQTLSRFFLLFLHDDGRIRIHTSD